MILGPILDLHLGVESEPHCEGAAATAAARRLRLEPQPSIHRPAVVFQSAINKQKCQQHGAVTSLRRKPKWTTS